MVNLSNFAQSLAVHAPSDETFSACMKRAEAEGITSCDTARVLEAKGRISGDAALRLWKGGTTPVERAALAAAACGDDEALRKIAKRERRQGVLHAVAYNPAASLETLLLVYPKASFTYSHRDKSISSILAEKVHERELTEELVELCEASENHTVRRALPSHPRLTGDVALRLLETDPGSGPVIAGRGDLKDLGEAVIERLLASGERYSVDPSLAHRVDLLALGDAVLRRVVESPLAHGALAERKDLPREVHEAMIDAHEKHLADAEADAVKHTWRASSLPGQRQWCWDALAGNETVDGDLLDRAPVTTGMARLIARRLTERYGNAPEKWELLIGIMATADGRSVGELLDTVEALG